MIREFFKKAFDIRDGEIFISFLMQLYIFIIITVLLIVKPTVNALFLSNLGASHLPYGYLLVALIAVVSSYFYNRAIQKFSIKNVAIFSLITFGVSFLVLSALLYYTVINAWVLYFFYTAVSLFAVLATSQFWILANLVYNVREAKRLFGFIGAGAIAGGVFGGYLTSILAPYVGNRTLIFIASILIVSCIPILQIVWRIRVHKLNVYIRKQRKEEKVSGYRSSFHLILKSKHLSYLAAIVGVGVIVAKLVDFQFSDFANAAIPNTDQLASFFGFWFSTFNLIALILQLFLTNRVLRYLGVTSSLLILPLGIALGSLLFLTFPELWVLVIIKGMDGSLKQSLNKAATELSILPIPSIIKNQAKSYIDIVVDSIATGVAGFLLIFIVRKMNLSSSYVTVIILLFLFIWITLIYKLKEAYFDSFRKNLQDSVIFDQESKKNLAKETTLKTVTKILNSKVESEILVLFERLKDHKIKPLKHSIVRLLDHPSNRVKAAAIGQLYAYDRGTAVEKVKKLMLIKDHELVYNALMYLIEHTDHIAETAFRSYLDSESDYMANAALLCLAKESSRNQKLAAKYNLISRIEAKIKEFSAPEIDHRKEKIAELLITIGYTRIPKYYSFISAHFNHKDAYVVKHAIKAAGLTSDIDFLNILIDFLTEKKYRKAATKALKKYGHEIARTLFLLDQKEDLPDKARRHIPRVIEKFKTQTSVKFLIKLLRSRDILIRLEASKSLNKLKRGSVDLKFDQRNLTSLILRESIFYKNTIRATAILQHANDAELQRNEKSDDYEERRLAREGLIEILSFQMEQSLECIFKLLSLKYEKSDMDVVYFGLKTDITETKVNAIEFLDNLLHHRLKSTLLPLLEIYTLQEDTTTIYRTFNLNRITEKKCLARLIKNRGRRIKLAVINLIQYSEDLNDIKLLSKLKKHKNNEVRRFTNIAIERLSADPELQV
ncbi:Npt1/Npt2 family nucleotide transporter [Aquimarina sp. M1]